jgi:hypothetical protein
MTPEVLRDRKLLYQDFRGFHPDQPGLLSLTVWESLQQPDLWLALFHHDSEEHRESSLRAFIESPLFEHLQGFMVDVPDIRVISVDAASGTPPGATGIGEWVSIVTHDSHIGEGVFTAREAVEISRDLQTLQGWRGNIIGRSVVLENEVYNLAFWDDLDTMQTELPLRFDTYVHVLRRIR